MKTSKYLWENIHTKDTKSEGFYHHNFVKKRKIFLVKTKYFPKVP